MIDKTKIIEILNDWNYWDRDVLNTINRELYDSKIENFLKKDEIIVIKGVRRSGKSTLMLNQIKKLHQNNIPKNNILFINFEDPRLINHLSLELLEQIYEVYFEYLNPSDKPYIFLDEVQNIDSWEKWVNKEYELKKSYITVSGSNSSMLSSEIATALSGRYISIEIFPLSFSEYLQFKDISIDTKLDFVSKKIELNRELEFYIKEGGFPQLLKYDKSEKKELLSSYKDSILLKDIVARFKLKNFHILEELAAFLVSNTGILQSKTKLKNNFKISFDMANDYLEYLKKAYMVFEINKFDYSLRKQNVNDKKYYSIDLGLCNVFRVPNLQTRGSDLETVVFLELLRRGYKVYYYKTSNDLECDFIVQKDNEIVQLIQVSISLEDEKTYKREIEPFEKTIDELKLKNLQCLIITEDSTKSISHKNINIDVLNIKEFLIKI
jgi:predicted AAA+ superfamily ATPase